MYSNDESDEDVLDLVVLTNLNSQRKFWVHPLWLQKCKSGTFDVMRELEMYPDRFQTFYRMSYECFYGVLDLVRDGLTSIVVQPRKPFHLFTKLYVELWVVTHIAQCEESRLKHHTELRK